MASPPLWLTVTPGPRQGQTVTVNVSLAHCRNCGKTKLTSDPCGFDHLAAILEYANAHRG